MKTLLLTTVLLLQVTIFYGNSAPGVRLEANAIDKNSGQALEYVAVTLLDANLNYVKGFLSTVNGHFSLNGLAYGNYFLKISNTGYEETIIPLEISQDVTDVVLGPITLQPQGKNCLKTKKQVPAIVVTVAEK